MDIMTGNSIFSNEVELASVSSITAEEFYSHYLIPRIPLIITDASANWQALEKWTWEWLVTQYGEVQVELTDSLNEKQQARLSEYIAYIFNPDEYPVKNGPLYLKDLHFGDELCDDYKTPAFVDDWFADFPVHSRPSFRWFFIGPRSTGSPLHVDTSGTHAWLTQIFGEKEWVLFPPDDLPESYCGVADAFNPDFDKFPAFRTVRCFRAILKAGETMFTPSGWRHQVRNLTPSWAITENFFNASNVMDVDRQAVHPMIRPILYSVCRRKTEQLRDDIGNSSATSQLDMLRAFFQEHERQLLLQLADVEQVLKSFKV